MSDLISRQAILDRTVNRNSIWNKITDSEGNNLEDILNSIPSVENKGEWIPVSERLPNVHEYIKNNGLFNVSDGNRSYFGWFDIYDTKRFVKPTIAGFRVDNAVIAWMPLPEPYKPEKIRCNTCKNNDDELSGECYECVKNIQNHYEPEEVKEESEDKE